MLAENYPFMKFNLEMKRIFEGGTLGTLLFAEGEYNHPLDPNDEKSIRRLRPYEKHWRNYLPRTYYITHSLGPLMYVSGAIPKRVTAMPVYTSAPADALMGLDVGDRAAIITCINNDGSAYRVTGCAAFGAHENSYRICGTKGQMENIRGEEKVLLRYNKWDVPEGGHSTSVYKPDWLDKDRALIEKAGHGGGDFFVIREFLDCIRENKKPVFDVYAATTMSSVGILAHRSLLERGMPYDIPDFRREEDRVKYENDHLSPFWGPNGEDPTLIASSHAEDHPSAEKMAAYDKLMEEID
jgi:predicted dehydrogenase